MTLMATDIDPARVMPRAILQAADFRDARVLEIGAGDGRLTFQYATEPGSIVAIDSHEPDLQTASRHAGAGFPGNVRLVCASAAALPFSGEEFPFVLLASSL